MKKRLISGIICTMMAVGMIMPVSAEEANTDFAGEELSILFPRDGWTIVTMKPSHDLKRPMM